MRLLAHDVAELRQVADVVRESASEKRRLCVLAVGERSDGAVELLGYAGLGVFARDGTAVVKENAVTGAQVRRLFAGLD